MNVILFGNRVFADVINSRSILDLQYALNPMTSVLTRKRRGRFETHGHRKRDLRRKPRGDGGRGWSYAATNQGTWEPAEETRRSKE